jgi:large subunit ribosomal protein L24
MKTTQPRKQRKMLFNAPLHVRNKLFSAPLSTALKATHRVSSVTVRTGDTVRVMRGDKKGVEGKVSRIERSKIRLFVDGVTREKVDGTPIQIPIHPSKIMITSLNLDDKKRRESLKAEAPEEAEKRVEEPKKEQKKRKPRKTTQTKAKTKTTRKRKTKSEEKSEGETETG